MKHLFGILTALFILASVETVFANSNANESPNFGDGVAAYSLQNYEKAVQIWSVLAEQGSADAAFRLAQLYDLGFGVEYNPDEVVKWLSMASEQGHTSAQFMLAEIYRIGKGVRVDNNKAFALYSVAAENGHPQAMYQLASIYYLGENVEKNLFLSAFWFYRASEDLNSAAQKQIAKDLYGSVFESLSDKEKLSLLKLLSL